MKLPQSVANVKTITSPIKRLAKATSTCSVTAKVYGDCVMESYQDVRPGMCKEEFKAFKDCVQGIMKRKW